MTVGMHGRLLAYPDLSVQSPVHPHQADSDALPSHINCDPHRNLLVINFVYAVSRKSDNKWAAHNQECQHPSLDRIRLFEDAEPATNKSSAQ